MVFTSWVLLLTLSCIRAFDDNVDDCHVCSSQTDKECLSTLTDYMDELSDKERLAFLRSIFTGSFQTTAHFQQIEIDATAIPGERRTRTRKETTPKKKI